MSPDARLIAVALIGQDCGPEEAVRRLGILETALPPAEPQPGIRGMVPVAYLKDVIEGFITRLEFNTGLPADDPLAYAKRRLADVEAL